MRNGYEYIFHIIIRFDWLMNYKRFLSGACMIIVSMMNVQYDFYNLKHLKENVIYIVGILLSWFDSTTLIGTNLSILLPDSSMTGHFNSISISSPVKSKLDL